MYIKPRWKRENNRIHNAIRRQLFNSLCIIILVRLVVLSEMRRIIRRKAYGIYVYKYIM